MYIYIYRNIYIYTIRRQRRSSTEIEPLLTGAATAPLLPLDPGQYWACAFYWPTDSGPGQFNFPAVFDSFDLSSWSLKYPPTNWLLMSMIWFIRTRYQSFKGFCSIGFSNRLLKYRSLLLCYNYLIEFSDVGIYVILFAQPLKYFISKNLILFGFYSISPAKRMMWLLHC